MTTMAGNMALEAWKRPFQCAAAAIEAMSDGSRKIREAQLKAAIQANADARALRERVAAAGDPQELWNIQSAWLLARFADALAYWCELSEIALATRAGIAGCVLRQMPPDTARAAPAAGEPQRQLVELMDSAYKRWLESTRQFYAPPVIAEPQIRQPA